LIFVFFCSQTFRHRFDFFCWEYGSLFRKISRCPEIGAAGQKIGLTVQKCFAARKLGRLGRNVSHDREIIKLLVKNEICFRRQTKTEGASAGFPARMCTLCFITFFALFSALLKFCRNF